MLSVVETRSTRPKFPQGYPFIKTKRWEHGVGFPSSVFAQRRAGDIRDAVERVLPLNGYSQDGRRQSLANILGCTGRLLEGILSIAIHRLML